MSNRKESKLSLMRRCRRFWLRDDGAVTVFAVIVLSALLLFFSVLIDYARIAAFHKLSEDAVRSGVRSVLSAYDSVLYERYGLFGRGGTEGQGIFEEVLKANADGEAGLSGEGIKLARMKLEAASLHPASFLGHHDVFKRQVLEEMKYKAPVDFTLELASKFAPVAGPMKEASAAISLLENMRRLYEKREAHLAAALQLQQQAASVVGGSGIEALIPVQTAAIGPGNETALLLASEYRTYAEQVIHDQSLPPEASPKYTEEIAAYEEKARSITLELRRISVDMLRLHAKRLGDALRELEAARLLNADMQRLAQQASQAAEGAGYDAVSKSKLPGDDQHQVPDGAASEIEQVKQTADELVLPESWFAEYKRELETQGTAAVALDTETGGFQSNISAAMAKPISSSDPQLLLEGVASLRLVYGDYEEKYIRPASILMNRKQQQDGGNIKAKLKQQEERASSLWTQARGMLQGLTAVPQTEEHIELFKQVRKRFDDNLLFNQRSDDAASEGGAEQAEDAHEAAEQAAAMMGGLFTGMAGMLERTRDTVYFGEYAVHRYSSFAPQNLRALFAGGDPSELAHAVSLNNQEAEYVIYGFHDPIGNIAAAYGELFATRLAVRTMEGLIESRALGHPLLILSAAIIYGLEKTMEDMLAFTERGTAPLSKYVKVELGYTDYLRLFMLIHGVDDARGLARMIAVIEQNSGAALSAVPSGVTGEAGVSIELWFVPGLMRVLGRVGLLEGKVVGNRYETTQTIGWSY
ncbi:TadE/TadG family type IV pilus assembly protein [Paenibacillus harenae]|uniref:TadE/TadG family type IV pilus assembly protein n=1 Tax=Paenibacillus harenae TaxID=306543 RepID=UPI000402A0EE|nr:hypothetical protein [Paenibacillus harenae]